MSRQTAWIPACCMLLCSLISYIDRNALAILAPTIRADAGMSEVEYGWVITSFSIAYMIGNPVWGWLLDRFGLRAGMTVAVMLWTAASAAHALTSEFWGLAIARAALGFGEGATFPGGLRTVMQTLPKHQRARGVAIAYSGGSLGAIVAPLVVTPIEAWWGWRAAFLFTGLIGIAWVALWLVVARRRDIRQLVIDDSFSETEGQAAQRASPKPELADTRVWAFMVAYALGGAPLAFILYYSASYLTQTFSLTQQDLGHVLWIAPLGWELGYFFWGWVSDRLHRTNRPAVVVERQLMALLAILSFPLAAVPFCPSFAGVLALQFFAMAVAAGFIILAVSYATHVYSTASSGLIAGLGAGAWSAGVAVASPIYGYLFDTRQFGAVFFLASVLPSAALILWMVLAGMWQAARSGQPT